MVRYQLVREVRPKRSRLFLSFHPAPGVGVSPAAPTSKASPFSLPTPHSRPPAPVPPVQHQELLAGRARGPRASRQAGAGNSGPQGKV